MQVIKFNKMTNIEDTIVENMTEEQKTLTTKKSLYAKAKVFN